jgi:TENA/THI-4/PQQC family
MTGASAGDVVAQTRSELADVAESIRSHRFLELLRTRDVPRERLGALAGAQHMIVSSDRRSFAVLAARFPGGLAGEFFLGMAEGEGLALHKLQGLRDWLGRTDAELRAHEPHAGIQAYPAFVAWLALNGSRADVVLAFLSNLAVWGDNCGAVAAALRDAYGADDAAVAFFDFFANPPAGFEARALAVLEEGSSAGTRPCPRVVPAGCCKPTSCLSGMRSPSGCDRGLSGNRTAHPQRRLPVPDGGAVGLSWRGDRIVSVLASRRVGVGGW